MASLLVDGNNLLMRSIFATQRSGMQVDGIATGPLLVFINTLTKHIREERPSRMGVAWDGGKSRERVALQADYKGNRTSAPDADVKESSFALAKEFCSLAGIYQTEFPGFEADDVIAAWWAREVPDDPPSRGIKILSSDKDFSQLIGLNPHGVPVEQIRLSSADTPTDRWTADRFEREYGYLHHNWPLVAALTGDKSDNVHGVPRIGPKTAVKLLEAHGWDLEVVITAEDRVSPFADQVRRNLELVDLRVPRLALPPVPRFQSTRPGSASHSDLLAFFDRYRLASARDRYLTGTFWAVPTEVIPGRHLGD